MVVKIELHLLTYKHVTVLNLEKTLLGCNVSVSTQSSFQLSCTLEQSVHSSHFNTHNIIVTILTLGKAQEVNVKSTYRL